MGAEPTGLGDGGLGGGVALGRRKAELSAAGAEAARNEAITRPPPHTRTASVPRAIIAATIRSGESQLRRRTRTSERAVVGRPPFGRRAGSEPV
jgi:hypothetical protein